MADRQSMGVWVGVALILAAIEAVTADFVLSCSPGRAGRRAAAALGGNIAVQVIVAIVVPHCSPPGAPDHQAQVHRR